MNIEIANRLQKLRKENGYSQEELADKLGISRQAVSKWERAESSPDTDNLIILARLYNMSLDELLYDNESDEEIRERIKDKENTNSKANDSIKIDKDTVNLTDDEGQTVRIEDGHIKLINPDGTEEHIDKKKKAIVAAIDGIIFICTLIAYILWSTLANAWYISWVLWVLMPAVMSIVEAVEYKQLSKFLYPVLVAAVYCFIGMKYELWHPYWLLFVTIPVYYIMANLFDVYVFKTKKEDQDEDQDKDE